MREEAVVERKELFQLQNCASSLDRVCVEVKREEVVEGEIYVVVEVKSESVIEAVVEDLRMMISELIEGETCDTIPSEVRVT